MRRERAILASAGFALRSRPIWNAPCSKPLHNLRLVEEVMRASDIMTQKVETVSPTDSIATASAKLKAIKTHHLVVMEGSRVVGVLSSRDISRGNAGATVEEMMTQSVVIASPDLTVQKMANLLRGRSIGCLPVIDGRKLVGIVTVSDLLELIGRNPVPTKSMQRSPWKRRPRRATQPSA
jgi:CBS domain-containing protein